VALPVSPRQLSEVTASSSKIHPIPVKISRHTTKMGKQ
jgi:hypothetical protein